MLLHTQGLDGLLHLYNRLETGGRVLLLCLLSAEAGWVILVTAWLRLERAYLKMRLFLSCNSSTACRGYAGLGQFPIFLLIQFFDPTGSPWLRGKRR
jgi:hypothetical protein